MYFKNLYFVCLFDSLRLSQKFVCPQLWNIALKGHIALGLSARPCVRPCMRPSVCPLQNLLHVRYSFEISYIDSSLKIIAWIFSVWIIPLCGGMPLLKGHNEVLKSRYIKNYNSLVS